MKNINIILLGFLLIMFAPGCETDELLKEQPPHIITAETLLTDYDGFNSAINGLYSLTKKWRSTAGGNDATRCQIALCGNDNLAVNYTAKDIIKVVEYWGELNNPSYSTFEKEFSWFYAIINAANTVIGRAENPEVDWGLNPEGNKNYIVAEAMAIRAWAYRHLTYLWGDVPLNLEESSGSTIRTDWARTPVNEVRQQIIEDFEFAEQYIPVEPAIAGRMTKGIVQHYLAEMYLVISDPESALLWASKPIDNPAYSLITERYGVKAGQAGVPFMDMFESGNANREEGNTEALWVFQYDRWAPGGGSANMRRPFHSRYRNISVNGVRPFQSSYARGGRGFGRVGITQYAWQLYEPQDDRRSPYAIRQFFTLKTAEENISPYADDILPPGYSFGDTIWCANLDDEDMTWTNRQRDDWPFTRKFDDMDIEDEICATFHWKDQPYVRLAETYLLKAEAQYLTGDLEGAAETINVVRRRSNASEITAADVNIDFILDERSRELLGEEERRYTLLRTGTWIERLQNYNMVSGDKVTERDLLFPIPQNVIDANLTYPMQQNPGYE